jgi:hypothetical protein
MNNIVKIKQEYIWCYAVQLGEFVLKLKKQSWLDQYLRFVWLMWNFNCSLKNIKYTKLKINMLNIERLDIVIIYHVTKFYVITLTNRKY